jgi:hypothetical protein
VAELFTNFAESTIYGSVGTSDTTINVASGDGALFPSPSGSDFFRAVVYKFATGEREVVYVTARSTDAMTVTRAQESTVALALNDGDLFELRATAGFLTTMATTTQIQEGTPNYAVAGGTANAITVTMSPAITTLAAGTVLRIKASADNTAATTINPNGIGAVNAKKVVAGAKADLAAADIKSGLIYEFISDGTDLVMLNRSNAAYVNSANTFSVQQVFSGRVVMSKGADVASAGTLTLGTDGNSFDVTGNTTITSVASIGVGTLSILQFDGVLDLVHHATDLILPGEGNITTAAGDIIALYEYATGDVRTIAYTKASGKPVREWANLGTEQATTSGTTKDFTGIPSWARRVHVHLAGVSTNGGDELMLLIGDSGGFETSGYLSSCVDVDATPSTSTSTAGFIITEEFVASIAVTGRIVLELMNGSNTWIATGNLSHDHGAGGNLNFSNGSKTLSGALDRVRLTTVGGVDTFDTGAVNITYE